MAFWKVQLSSRNKPQPSCFFAEESNTCLCLTNPSALQGQGRSGLPLAPWALLVCWWSPELETHSSHIVLHGKAGFEMKRPCVHRPQQSTLSQTWRSTPRSHLTDDTKPGHDSCILESETNFKEQTTNPMRLCSGKQRLPFCPLSLCSQ